jgi:hypothetical protein
MPCKCGQPSRKGGRYCSECHRSYQKAWYRVNPASSIASAKRRKSNRREFIKEAKSVPCADCNGSFPYYVMDFDHVRGEKQFILSEAANKMASLDAIEEEIAKCDVVCANCHRVRTYVRSLGGRQSGKVSNL